MRNRPVFTNLSASLGLCDGVGWRDQGLGRFDLFKREQENRQELCDLNGVFAKIDENNLARRIEVSCRA
jgi:hypothetical protein